MKIADTLEGLAVVLEDALDQIQDTWEKNVLDPAIVKEMLVLHINLKLARDIILLQKNEGQTGQGAALWALMLKEVDKNGS